MAAVRRGPVAGFLFCSGACALVYQVAWTREFRLVFGASTAASAAVLAIFIGGLGAGGLWLGARADRAKSPLMMYGNLEAVVALSAAATPLLLKAARAAYLGIGGASTLGDAGGTVARLALSALVLAVPTFAMGGTLPAAVRAAQGEADQGRRDTALLYGANTMGAVTGSLATTFVLLEVFGTQISLWLACLVNLLVAMVARMVARSGAFVELAPAPPPEPVAASRAEAAPAPFVLASALIVGFVFFLMELVWYRMLGPLLGGSVFTFGIILAVALAGIGLGGLSYALLGKNRPATLSAFAVTSLLEALLVAVPFALGDRLAVLAGSLRALGAFGFVGLSTAWVAVAAIVVFPAAFASGVQFPLLIALLGRGRDGVGRQLGLTYAWNTVGAILGSLAGGFGLVPALGAPGAWRLVGILLAGIGLAAGGLAALRTRRPLLLVLPAALSALTFVTLAATGPTAAWRHTPIGAGRVAISTFSTPTTTHAWLSDARARVLWERDGVESSVALTQGDDVSFVVNGKTDGSYRTDAATQVMAGIVGGCLHGSPRSAYVIGVGTGSSAGWLGVFPGIVRVDVAEIEPAILDVARHGALINKDMLRNPRVQVHLHDAREGLLTSHRRFDLIVSEPSNPYRAGISSLFTREYYEAVASRLSDTGLFLQWVQAYEIDAETVRSIYGTVGGVLPNIETWRLETNDLLLVASKHPRAVTVAAIEACMKDEAVREALRVAWTTDSTAGFLAHYVARPSFATYLRGAYKDQPLNTDDQNPLEFGLARTVGVAGLLGHDVVEAAAARGESRPAPDAGSIDQALVDDELVSQGFARDTGAALPAGASPELAARHRALSAWLRADAPDAVHAWKQQPKAPTTILERVAMSEAFAAVGDPAAPGLAQALDATHPAEAALARALYELAAQRADDALPHLSRTFAVMRENPWMVGPSAEHALAVAVSAARDQPRLAPAIYEMLKRPFAAGLFESRRIMAAFEVSRKLRGGAVCVEALQPFEKNPPWSIPILTARAACYAELNDPRRAAADADLARALAYQPAKLDPDAPPPAPPPRRRPQAPSVSASAAAAVSAPGSASAAPATSAPAAPSASTPPPAPAPSR